jgi:hypothetical protein
MSFTITVAMPLITVDPQKYTNACVLGITDEGKINVYTDFGNVLLLELEQVYARYNPSQAWLDYLEYGGVSESLYQRIDMQIKLLEMAKSYVVAGTNNDRSPHV